MKSSNKVDPEPMHHHKPRMRGWGLSFSYLPLGMQEMKSSIKVSLTVGLVIYNHWVSYSRIEREPPMIYLYPYRRDFERSEFPLSRCVPADNHSDLGGSLGRNQIPQIQQVQASQDATLAHALPRGLGFDNLNTRELWGAYEDGLEETHEVGPVSGAHQPSEGAESSVSNHASPETSEVNSNITNRVGCVAVVKGGPRPEPTLLGPARIEIQGVKPNSILQRHLNSGYSLEHYQLPVGASCLPHAPRSSKG